MGKYDEFVNDCQHELDRHEQRLKTDEEYLWFYLASWFEECNWPEGTSDEDKLIVLESLLYVAITTGHIMAIKEAIRRLKERMAEKQFAAAVESISQTFCYA